VGICGPRGRGRGAACGMGGAHRRPLGLLVKLKRGRAHTLARGAAAHCLSRNPRPRRATARGRTLRFAAACPIYTAALFMIRGGHTSAHATCDRLLGSRVR
jgi:hypothetical protein